ncbi:MAG: ABC transporter permease [Alphaproteobacteria bacterium]|nr:ABC transporter permease [Alphaproteobacteria bacterium]
MIRMIALRLGLTLPILLGVSVIAFVLMRALPGDFAQASAGTSTISAEALDTIRRNLGLDLPVWRQYLRWLAAALGGDLGTSFTLRKPVMSELLPRLAVTGELTLIAGLMAMTLGVTTGLASARFRGAADWLVRGWNSLLLAVPNFVIATLIVLLFGLYFPAIGIFNYVAFAADPLSNVASMLLPALSLALTVSVTISENTRAAVLEVASQDYVMVAKAKGLRARTILGHYLVRNALTPVITVTGLQLAALLGGSILIETIFTIPGMGQFLFDSIASRDYPSIQAIVLVAATIVLLMNVLVDIAYARVDARVSYD